MLKLSLTVKNVWKANDEKGVQAISNSGQR